MQPPAQELVARDLHDTVWTFRHIFRGKLICYFHFFGCYGHCSLGIPELFLI